MKLMCPNCNAIWGMEEINWQECGSCGWPDIVEEDNYFEDEYDQFHYNSRHDDSDDSIINT